MLLLSLNYLIAFFVSDLSYFFVPFSNWALMFTTASLLLSYRAVSDVEHFGFSSLVHPGKHASEEKVKKFKSSLKIQAWHNILYFLSLLSNIVVLGVYWGLLHEQALKEYGHIPG